MLSNFKANTKAKVSKKTTKKNTCHFEAFLFFYNEDSSKFHSRKSYCQANSKTKVICELLRCNNTRNIVLMNVLIKDSSSWKLENPLPGISEFAVLSYRPTIQN